MSGETFLIVKDLKQGLSIKEVSVKYQKTEGNIRAIAKRHCIDFKQPKKTAQDRKRKKSAADAKRYRVEKEELFKRTRPDILLPSQPLQAAKLGGLSRLNDAWAMKQGAQRGIVDDVQSQIKYGLKTRLIGH